MHKMMILLYFYFILTITVRLSALEYKSNPYSQIQDYLNHYRSIKQSADVRKKINLAQNELVRLNDIKQVLKAWNPRLNTDTITADSLKAALQKVNQKMGHGLPGFAGLNLDDLKKKAANNNLKILPSTGNTQNPHILGLKPKSHIQTETKPTEKPKPHRKLKMHYSNKDQSKKTEKRTKHTEESVETFAKQESFDKPEYITPNVTNMSEFRSLISNLTADVIIPEFKKAVPDLQNTVSQIKNLYPDLESFIPNQVKNMIPKLQESILPNIQKMFDKKPQPNLHSKLIKNQFKPNLSNNKVKRSYNKKTFNVESLTSNRRDNHFPGPHNNNANKKRSKEKLKLKRRQAEDKGREFYTEWIKYAIPIDIKIVGYLQLPQPK